MKAEVEKPDGSYKLMEMGEPVCGEDFCDTCGDCLVCYPHYDEDWCSTGERWVIYLNNPKNPFFKGPAMNEMLLKSSLEVAVPLWIDMFKNYEWDDLEKVLTESEAVLADCAEGISHRIEGKSEAAFNAVARAIAALSFVPGGIEICGLKYETERTK